MELRVISLFPEMISAVSSFGVFGRAVRRGLVDLKTFDPRDFTIDAHRTVDDRPYGGGPGMVLKVEPWRDAIHAAKATANSQSPVVFLGPQGRRFDQDVARELSELPGMILVAGRYEGFDERLLETECDVEFSLGDFVLSGGEIAAAAVMDTVVRLLPAVLGDEASAQQDSFGDDLLDCPHYTRPEQLGELGVPDVLLNGNHEEIRRWRLKQSLGRTYLRRPDLLARRELTSEEQTLLQEFMQEHYEQSGVPGRLHH